MSIHGAKRSLGMPSSDDPVTPAWLPSRRRDTVLGAAGRMLWDLERSADPGLLPPGDAPASAPCSERRMLYGSGPRPAHQARRLSFRPAHARLAPVQHGLNIPSCSASKPKASRCGCYHEAATTSVKDRTRAQL